MEASFEFLQSVAKDAGLQARLAAATGPEAYVAIAAQCGYDLTVEEMEKALGIDANLAEERLTPAYADACSYCVTPCCKIIVTNEVH